MKRKGGNRADNQRTNWLQACRLNAKISAELRQFRPGPEGKIQLLQGLTDCLVRSRRLELPRPFGHNDLNVARLPVPPRPHIEKDPGEPGPW